MAKTHKPGRDSASSDHYNPHGADHAPAPHMGMTRTSSGGFTGNAGNHMSQGGCSPHGDQTVSRLKKGGSSNQNPAVSQPYDSDGDDWL